MPDIPPPPSLFYVYIYMDILFIPQILSFYEDLAVLSHPVFRHYAKRKERERIVERAPPP